MLPLQKSANSRRRLDARFGDLHPVSRFAPPPRGWIKAIREGLGMSSAQLARRLNIKQPSVVAIEQSEHKATIQLDTLRRVAEALDCALVYALVPKDSLESTVGHRAREIARRYLESVEHSMLLENQSASNAVSDSQLDVLSQRVSPRALWEDP